MVSGWPSMEAELSIISSSAEGSALSSPSICTFTGSICSITVSMIPPYM
ncbi:MAG: hypothetical protein IKH04_01785 [Kiritimatiellae bacterium]|nr:hypothetical protein [Kiritimatiellia bacterium]